MTTPTRSTAVTAPPLLNSTAISTHLVMDSLGRSYSQPKDPTGTIDGTPRQLDLLQFIYRYPYVPSHYIDHYFGLTRFGAKIRTELFSKGYITKFIKAFHPNALTGTLALMPKNSWALTDKGIAFLQSRRSTHLYIPQGRFNDHQLFSSVIGTSIAFGAKEHGLTIAYPEDILRHSRTTERNPFKVKIGEHRLEADARPFKVQNGKSYIFFWGFEADLSNETLKGGAPNTILSKFRRYEGFLTQDLHYLRLGMKNVKFWFVSTNPTHVQNMRTLARDPKHITPKFQNNFLFTTMEDYSQNLDFPDPANHLLNRPCFTPTGTYSIVEKLKGQPSGHEIGTDSRTHQQEGGDRPGA